MADFRFSVIHGVVWAALAASSAVADEVTVATAQGDAAVTGNPETLAVMDIAAIDTLDALGITPAGVPDNLYVGYLDDLADSTQAVGTLFEPDLEALAGLAPDLIVVGSRSSTQLDAVSQVAPAIDMTIGTDLTGDAKARLAAYGRIFGKESEAEELIASLDEKLAALDAATPEGDNALIVMTNGPKMAAYGKGSRFGWLFDVTGLEEAVPNLDAETHGDAINHEFIAEADPDWLIVIDRGIAVGSEEQTAETTLKSALVEGTKAWQQGHVIYPEPTGLYIAGGGYQSLTNTVEELTAAFAK